MNLDTLSRIMEAIREIEPRRRLLLIGSSSLLASFPNQAPETLGIEVTMDADIILDPDDAQQREALLGIMGEGGAYHSENGFYCDFVDARADSWLPPGWKTRLVPFPGYGNVFALHPVDASAAKLSATAHARVDKRLGRRLHDRGRKDIDTVAALVRSRCVDLSEVTARMHEMPLAPAYLAELAPVLAEVRLQTDGDF